MLPNSADFHGVLRVNRIFNAEDAEKITLSSPKRAAFQLLFCRDQKMHRRRGERDVLVVRKSGGLEHPF